MSDTIESLPLAQAAAELGVAEGRVLQLLRDGALAAVRRDGEIQIPAEFLLGGGVVKGLPGALTLLRDAGYSEEEAVRWLFTADDSLPGTPIQALRENRGKEVRRRAQALGF